MDFKTDVGSKSVCNQYTPSDTKIYTETPLAAVVVAYQPPPAFWASARSLADRFESVFIIDNTVYDRSTSSEFIPSARITYVQNGRNLGVAAAINTGVDLAATQGFEWAVLLDQDTLLPDEFIAAAKLAANSVADDKRVALFAPAYEDQGTVFQSPETASQSSGIPRYLPLEIAITSGALVRIPSFIAVGRLDDRLFIDYVDFDLCIRLRINNCTMLALPVTMQHSVGKLTRHHLFHKQLLASNHPPRRLFSAGRNLTVLTQRYFGIERSLILRFWVIEFKRLVTILFCEKQAVKKIMAFIAGVIEAVRFRDKNSIGNSNFYRDA